MPSREPGGFLSTPESWDAFGKGSPPQGHPSLGLPELALWLEELGWAPCPSRGELARRPAGRAGPGLAPVGTRIWISVSGWGHLISVNWMAAKASGDSGARKSWLISFFSQFEASKTSSDLRGHIFLVGLSHQAPASTLEESRCETQLSFKLRERDLRGHSHRVLRMSRGL